VHIRLYFQADLPMKSKRIVASNFEIAFIWGDRLTFDYHSHDEYVLSCNIVGNEKLVLDGRSMEAAESCTTLYNPGQIQKGDGTECLVSIYLDARFFEREMMAARDVSYDAPIVNDPDLLRQFSAMASLVLSGTQNSVAEEAVIRAIDSTLSRYTVLKSRKEPGADWRAGRVRELLLSRLDRQDISLEELGREVGIDKFALVRMFSRAFGMPPITWQRAKRIEAARRLLKSGMPAAETAYRTGFSDQSHLTRWFGRAYGISPVRFARMH
jgi:AraC family chemosensory pili system transcriptional regulator ChpD